MSKLKKFCPYLLVIVSFFFTLYVMDKNCDYILDSDISSEIILGKLLHDEGGIISKNWLYATELRVINTQLIYKLCFNFSNNWHNVRVMSIGCIMLILFGSYYLLMSRLDLKKYAWLTGFALLLPFSKEYCEFALLCGYTTHITIIFLTLALFIPYDKNKLIDKTLFAVNCILAILSGLNGIRNITLIYLPLILTSIFLFINNHNKVTKTLIKRSLTLLFSNLVGVFINIKVLSVAFSFQHLEKVSLTNNFSFAKLL
ncbi:hypothetical protein IJT10_06345, partial [bacterium]|nr:hypothetical protein [bacterium]